MGLGSIMQRHKQCVGRPANYTGAGLTEVWLSLEHFRRVCFHIMTGAWAGGTAAVTLKQATSAAGAGSKALALPHYWDDLTLTGTYVKKTATADTFDLDTALKSYIVDVDAAELDTDNGFKYIAIDVATPGVNADLYAISAELYDARYEQKTLPDVLA